MTEQRNWFSFEGKLTVIISCVAVVLAALGAGLHVLTDSAWL